MENCRKQTSRICAHSLTYRPLVGYNRSSIPRLAITLGDQLPQFQESAAMEGRRFPSLRLVVLL